LFSLTGDELHLFLGYGAGVRWLMGAWESRDCVTIRNFLIIACLQKLVWGSLPLDGWWVPGSHRALRDDLLFSLTSCTCSWVQRGPSMIDGCLGITRLRDNQEFFNYCVIGVSWIRRVRPYVAGAFCPFLDRLRDRYRLSPGCMTDF
jgi:hypothetical protein